MNATLVPGDALPTIVTAIWIVLTILAFAGGAWLLSLFRHDEQLGLGESLARREIGLDEFRAKASPIGR